MAADGPRLTFTDWDVRIAVTFLPAILLLVGVSNVLDAATRPLGAVALVAGAVLTVRACRSATVIVDDQAVTTRGLFRTHRYPLGEIDRAGTSEELDRAQEIFDRQGSVHLALFMTDGRSARFRSLRDARGPDPRSLVPRTVVAINGRVARSRDTR